ncbi:MAG: hypothetical protein ACE5M4_12470 [Anaerolineales bacterium]
MTKTSAQLLSVVWVLAIAMFLIGPIAVGWMGTHIRYIGDDYCHLSELARGGFFGGQVSAFQMKTRFSGDRYSSTILTFLTGLLGPIGFGAAVATMLALWLSGLFLVFYQLLRMLEFEHARKPSLAAASVMTFFILLTNADLFSSIYWVAAMYSYFAPMVVIMWLTVAVLHILRNQSITWWKLLALFVLTWMLGAMSEAGALMQIAWLLLMALAVWGIEGKRFWQRDYKLFLAPLLGSTLALVTMLLSPYGRAFLSIGATSVDPVGLALRVLRSSADYYLSPGEGFTTPFAVEVIMLVSMGFLLSRTTRLAVNMGWIRFALMISAIFLAGWLLVAVAFFPNYLVLGSSPTVRALTPAQITRQLAYASLFIAIGWALARVTRLQRWVHSYGLVIAPLAMLVASLYPIRGYPYLVERAPFMKRWATLWDLRDRQIRAAALNGVSSIHVMELDHPIPWIAELGPDTSAGYNVCAQEYYGIPEIIADLPGWDSYDPP